MLLASSGEPSVLHVPHHSTCPDAQTPPLAAVVAKVFDWEVGLESHSHVCSAMVEADLEETRAALHLPAGERR